MTSDKFTEQYMPALPAVPPAYSLLVAADVQGESSGFDRHVMGQGAKWAPEQIGGGGSIGIDCPGHTAAMGETTNPVVNTADPFNVFAEDHCSVLSGQERDFEGRGRRQLEATQSFRIAREFQLGTIRDAEGLANYCLKDATQIHPGDPSGSGDVPVLTAIALLESALGDTFAGRRCMIHLPMELFIFIGDGHLLKQQGARYVTPSGTIVAADAGYTHEADGYMYAYGTGPVQVLLGSPQVWPGSYEDAYNGAVDYTVNKVRIYAQRSAIVRVDGGINAAPGVGTADAMFKVQLGSPLWATHS